MNSTLKPVLPASSQNSNSSSSNKSMHPQGAPITYSQPSGPISQNPYPNTNMAHNHPTTQQNHFSLNVPGSGSHFNLGSIPASNHPVAISQPSTGQNHTSPKNVFSSSFQHGGSHNAQNQNTLPPVSQTLPATTTASTTAQNLNASTAKDTVDKDKTQSNGTSGADSISHKTDKTDAQGNHVSSTPQSTENKPVPQTSSQQGDKPKPATSPQEKKPVQEAKPVSEPKPTQEPPKVSEEPSQTVSQTPSVPSSQNVSSTPVAVPEPITAPVPSSEPAEPETVQNDSESSKDTPETDPLAIDSSAIVSDDKPSQAVPIIEAKDDSDGDEKSSEEQSSEESEKEKEPVSKTPVRKAKSKAEVKATAQKSPSSGKVKRQRVRTQHYQCPLPEIEIITKITSTPKSKNNDDKLIYFYKNEFMAVRNAEGGFYLCQAVQNIYKSSSKIKIRWLSQDKTDKSGEIYTPDFYDLTDFDCILTSLDLTRVGKGRYRLKPEEKLRTDNILKRCLAVEKGEISQPSVSEEHPDGLDLSLYKDEEQLKMKAGRKRKSRPRSVSPKKATPVKKAPEAPKVRKVEPRATKSSSPAKKPVVVKKPPTPEPKKTIPTTSRSSRGKRKGGNVKTSPVMDQKKAKVLAKIGRKTAVAASTSKPTTSKNSKVSKPVPSTSKMTKASTSKPPPRKAKKSGRK